MITVHHLENSRSQRLLWLLEEMGLSYDIEHYKRDAVTSLAPPSLRAVHPLGKSPVLTDEDITLAESGAIIEYLVTEYDDGRWRPTDGTAARRDYNFWLHYAEGSMMPLLLLSLILGRIETAKMPFFAKPIAKQIAGKVRAGFLTENLDRHLSFVDQTLGQQAWFGGGDISAADIQMSFPLEAAAVRTDLKTHYPNVAAYLEKIHARPAYEAALKKGGPYKLMGGE